MKKVKVKMLVSLAGEADQRYGLPAHGYAPGQEVSVHPELAQHWIAAGMAEAVEAEDADPKKKK